MFQYFFSTDGVWRYEPHHSNWILCLYLATRTRSTQMSTIIMWCLVASASPHRKVEKIPDDKWLFDSVVVWWIQVIVCKPFWCVHCWPCYAATLVASAQWNSQDEAFLFKIPNRMPNQTLASFFILENFNGIREQINAHNPRSTNKHSIVLSNVDHRFNPLFLKASRGHLFHLYAPGSGTTL